MQLGNVFLIFCYMTQCILFPCVNIFFHSDMFCHCRLSYISFGYGVFIFLKFKEVAGFFLRFSFTSKMLSSVIHFSQKRINFSKNVVKSCFATENQSDIIMLANFLDFSRFLKCAYRIDIISCSSGSSSYF